MSAPSLTPLGLALLSLRERRTLCYAGLIGALVAGVITVATPRTWTVAFGFAPASPDGPTGQLAGLAAQFGVNVGSGGASQGPEFYLQLLRTRELLLRVAQAEYDYEAIIGPPLWRRSERFTGDLADLYEIDPEVPAPQRSELAVQQLVERMGVQMDVTSGIVRVEVRAPHAAQAAAIGEQIIAAINDFNLEARRSQAGAERAFVAERLEAAQRELRSAEDRLQGFLQRNQQFRQSSALAFELERLQQEVAMRRQLLTSLAQAYEQSRIEEVRSTPVISVVEPPRLPPFPARRRLPLKVVLGGVLGAAAALLWVVGREARRHLAVTSEEWRDLEAQVGRVLGPLRRGGQRGE